LLLSPDLRVVDPAQEPELLPRGNRSGIDTATIHGVRLEVVI